MQDEVPEDVLEQYKKLIDACSGIELKGGKKLPYTSVNGYMFSSLTKDGRVGIRLSKEKREEFMTKFGAIQFKNYGANIKEHVEIPTKMLYDIETLKEWLNLSHKYTKSLPPK